MLRKFKELIAKTSTTDHIKVLNRLIQPFMWWPVDAYTLRMIEDAFNANGYTMSGALPCLTITVTHPNLVGKLEFNMGNGTWSVLP